MQYDFGSQVNRQTITVFVVNTIPLHVGYRIQFRQLSKLCRSQHPPTAHEGASISEALKHASQSLQNVLQNPKLV